MGFKCMGIQFQSLSQLPLHTGDLSPVSCLERTDPWNPLNNHTLHPAAWNHHPFQWPDTLHTVSVQSTLVYVFAYVKSSFEIHHLSYENILYLYDQIVAFTSCPVIIKLDPAFVFKDIIGNGSIQLLQIQVKVPTVLIDLCSVWGLSDCLPGVCQAQRENK